MTEKLKGIAGSMYAGKTDLLLREVTRAEIAKKNVLLFKPKLDDRWGKIDVVRSHSGSEHPAYVIENSEEIIDIVTSYLQEKGHLDLVAIDETQFFDQAIIDVVLALLEADIPVIFSGLSEDFRGIPFGSMPTLLAISDEIDRPTAICTEDVNGKPCGEPATKTQRLIDGKPAKYSDPVILIGAEDEGYHARCVKHHQVPDKPKPKITIYSK